MHASSASDPLNRVLDLGSTKMTRGIIIGIIGALLVHVAGASEAVRLADGLGRWAHDLRLDVHAYLFRFYEVEMVEPPPPPPPPPPEEPKPEPEAPKPVAAAAPREHEPAPAPAQAGKILTQEPDDNAPVDLTGDGFVTGSADTYAGGVTASNGTSTKAVRNLNAVAGGQPGGTGTQPGPAAPSGPDLSRPPSASGASEWDCPFPPEADADQIDFQRVEIAVTVRADGAAQDVKVIADPGHGFGRAARQCALRRAWTPALDRQGKPTAGTIPRVGVTFRR
ncbi:MAG TPA: energy transducer TonB [Polyangiaceae bacterium]|nr:energy transducer TonB [Polyangiaceae bacterium]